MTRKPKTPRVEKPRPDGQPSGGVDSASAYEITRPQFVLMGEAQTLPGLLFRLVQPNGATRDLLCDSMLDAAVFARFFGADLSLAMPSVRSPMRALSYENLEPTFGGPGIAPLSARLRPRDDEHGVLASERAML